VRKLLALCRRYAAAPEEEEKESKSQPLISLKAAITSAKTSSSLESTLTPAHCRDSKSTQHDGCTSKHPMTNEPQRQGTN